MNALPDPPLTSPSTEQWIDFLRRSFETRILKPPFGTHDSELHQALINVHRSITIPNARHAYDDALAAMFDSIAASPHLTWELFTLLQLVAYAKPVNAKQVVRRIVVTELLLSRTYAGYDLHALALAAASKYAVDDFLLDYIDRSARRTADIRYLLTCFRIRASANSTTALLMLLHLVGAAQDSGEVQMIVRELRGHTGVYGHRSLLEWYLDHRDIGASDATHWTLFEELLFRDVAGNTITSDRTSDPNRVALAAALLSGRQPLSPVDYAAITAIEECGEARATRTLEFLWRQQIANGWRVYVLGPDEYEKADRRPDDAILVYLADGNRVYISQKTYPTIANTLLRLEHSSSKRTRSAAAL